MRKHRLFLLMRNSSTGEEQMHLATSNPSRKRAPEAGLNTRAQSLSRWIPVALVALTVLAYLPLWRCDFITYDDPEYVTENANVTDGLTAKSFIWAFTTFHAGNWHPVTWLSHMVDCQLWHLNPVVPHLVNLALHLANSLLLFVVLRRMTGAVWRGGVVAALFAVHPLHVESVAWVAERKDVLCGLFWLLTMRMYVGFSTANDKVSRRTFNLLALGCFVLGLMSKPMIVTLPNLLLMMDYWPLRRLDSITWKRRVLEKLPFVMLSVTVSLITIEAQTRAGAVRDFGVLPLSTRLANAPVALFGYVGKLIWRVNLAVLYPYEKWPTTKIIAAAIAFVAVGWGAYVLRKRHRALFFGWFWFVVTLLPVIGFVQAGMQSIADRYTYIPSIGLFIVASFAFVECLHQSGPLRNVAIGAVSMVLVACCWPPSSRFNSGEILKRCSHTRLPSRPTILSFTTILDSIYKDRAGWRRALAHFQAAEKIENECPETHNNLACVCLIQGKLDESIYQSNYALKLRPHFPEAQVNLGRALFLRGDSSKSLELLLSAIDYVPQNATAHVDLAEVLIKVGQRDKAIVHLVRALELDPSLSGVRLKLAALFVEQDNEAAAIEQYRKALVVDPNSFECLNNLAWILATARQDNIRNSTDPVRFGEWVMRLGGSNSFAALDTLAAAYAEAGRFSDALRVIEVGIPIADAAGSPAAGRMRARRELYRSHQPYHGQ
jgi:protein O-mannosyl-transferase